MDVGRAGTTEKALLVLTLCGAVAIALLYSSVQSLSAERLAQQNLRLQMEAILEDLSEQRGQKLKLLEDLRSSLDSESLSLAGLEGQLREAREMADPDLETLKASALENLRAAEFEEADAPEAASGSFNLTTPENRERTRPMDHEIQYLRAEAQYGRFLDDLGIGSPRRKDILDSIALSTQKLQALSYQMLNGEISMDEFQEDARENNLNSVLESLFTPEEMPALDQYRTESRHQAAINEVFMQLSLKYANSLTPRKMHLVADVYQKRVTDLPDSGSPSEQLAARTRAHAAVFDELSDVLEPDELDDLQIFLDEQAGK